MTPRMIRIPDWLWDAAGREARANGMSNAEFVRLALASVVTLSAARRDAAYIGPVDELMAQAQAVLAAQDDGEG